MKKRYLILLAGAFMLTGCQLNKGYELIETSEIIAASETEAVTKSTERVTEKQTETETENVLDTTAGEIIVTLNSSEEDTEVETTTERHYEADETVPDKVLPTDENGEWVDYKLVTVDTHKEFWDPEKNDELGEFGVTFLVQNFPVIYSFGNTKLQEKLNKILTEYVVNDYRHRFQMKDLKLELVCLPFNTDSRFISFELAGTIYHVGGDSRYQEEKEYRYYFTMDRMTGTIITADMAYGMDNIVNEISEGNYTVVRAEKSVFENFDNALLARTYADEPMFTDDVIHEKDFYFQDGKMYVVIWVGTENGSYAILEMNNRPKLLEEKDKSIGETETETENEESAADTSAETAQD